MLSFPDQEAAAGTHLETPFSKGRLVGKCTANLVITKKFYFAVACFDLDFTRGRQ